MLQAPFCCVTGSEGGIPAQLEADVSQNCWPFQGFTPGPGQHLAHSPGGKPLHVPYGQRHMSVNTLVMLQVGTEGLPLLPVCPSPFSSCRVMSLLVASCGSPVHILGGQFSSRMVLGGKKGEGCETLYLCVSFWRQRD